MNLKHVYENAWIFKLPILRNYAAITLGPFVFFKGALDLDILDHEKIHLVQLAFLSMIGRVIMRNPLYGILYFYVAYLLAFIFNLFKYRFNWYKAYRNIPFEVEAYLLSAK